MERGIVITPNYQALKGGRGVQISGGVDPTNLRKYLLFWDKIDYPVNNMIHYAGGPDIDFLIQEGAAKSTEVRFQKMEAHENGFIFLASQMAAFDRNNEEANEEWSIAQPTSELLVPISEAKTQGCLEFAAV